MKDSNDSNGPEFLRYVHELNHGKKVMEALGLGMLDIENLDTEQLGRIGLRTYAEGKWTIHKIFQHLIDWERIWCFRAVIFARAEGTIPVAHDQEVMADNSNADELPLDQLIKELHIVRQSTIALFESFDTTIMEIGCSFFEYEISVREIGLTIAAHQIHHFNVIRERYLPLDNRT